MCILAPLFFPLLFSQHYSSGWLRRNGTEVLFFLLFFKEWHQEWRGKMPGSFLWGCGHGWLKCSSSWNADWEPGGKRRHRSGMFNTFDQVILYEIDTVERWTDRLKSLSPLWYVCNVRLKNSIMVFFFNLTVTAMYFFWNTYPKSKLCTNSMQVLNIWWCSHRKSDIMKYTQNKQRACKIQTVFLSSCSPKMQYVKEMGAVKVHVKEMKINCEWWWDSSRKILKNKRN